MQSTVQLCIVDATYYTQMYTISPAMYYVCSYSDSVNEKVAKYCTDQLLQEYSQKYSPLQIESKFQCVIFVQLCVLLYWLTI